MNNLQFTINDLIKKHKAGFTVVETLVAITVLAIAVAGPLSIAFQGLRSAQLAKHQIVASYLAQEGIEYIRIIRDQDYIDPSPVAVTFNTTLFATCTLPIGLDDHGCCNTAVNPFGCWIDMPDAEMGVCSDATCSNQGPVEYHDVSGRYGYANGYLDSPYTRIVKMTPLNIGGAKTEFLVTSTVTWVTGPISRELVVTETITNWQSNI